MKLSRLARLGLAAALGALVMIPRTAHGDEFDDIKASIQARAAILEGLKSRGELNEGSNGFIVPSPEATPEARKVGDTENSERLKMFGLVATRSGASVEEVARRFAERVPRSASPDQPTTPADRSTSDRSFVPVKDGSSLPLKVLTRPISPLYAGPSLTSEKLVAEVPAFTAYVVAARENGWYRVTERIGMKPAGWMNESDVMEWRHHMVVSFTHPGKRNRNLVFKEEDTLASLLRLPQTQRQPAWSRHLLDADKGVDPEIVGVEPDGWLREKNQFYLLPILDQKEIADAGQEMMLLRVAAATRERGAAKQPTAQPIRRIPKMDIVFVMDLTRSMGPFVTSTLEMLNDIAGRFDDSEIGVGAVRFGLWGYRDDPTLCPGIEFNTHNFTPEMQDLKTFVETLRSVNETKVDSIDYAEDVFAGVSDAILKTKWRDGAVKSILLVSDAPGRGLDESEPECKADRKPKGTASKMDATALRAMATANSVYLAAFYLEASKWKNFTALGSEQFKSLAQNPGSQIPVFKLLTADNPKDYAAAADDYASRLAENIKNLGQEGTLPPANEEPGQDERPIDTGRAMADNLFRNAFIEWNSANRDLAPPRDVEGWMTDKDPADPSRMSLDPGVLLTKSQLSELRDRVNDVIDALLKSELSGQDFFKELQAVVTIGGRDPGRLREAKTLMESDHFPDFLSGLPYKSKIMGMTKDDWREMSPDRTNQYRNEIVSKVGYYAEIYKDASKWQRLNSNADSGEYVTPIPIDMLP